MKTGLLIGYFVDSRQAREAFKKLQSKGYRRIAWVSKSTAGEINTEDPFIWLRIFWAAVGFMLFGAIATVISLNLQEPGPLLSRLPPALIPAAVCGIIGILLSIVWVQRSRFGVERRILEDHARWLISGEIVLLLQAPIENLRIPMNVFLEGDETLPSFFIVHPLRKSFLHEQEKKGPKETPQSPAQLRMHAQRLAVSHQLAPQPLRKSKLLRQLEWARRWVQQVCQDLSEASNLQQSVPLTAEWLLDNEYLLESNARNVRLNLPWPYYRQLPALKNELNPGLPRIYDLAWELAAHTELRLDEENILAFIEGYQTTRPLSIGELWALPQLLRMVLIEHIGRIASQALTELREQEVAGFWANRLITAKRRDPQQLFLIMADLSAKYPNPSLNFASQLIDYLYDEGQALDLVRSWLEHSFHKSLNDLIPKVKNLQAIEQISIGNAFTSLRQLDLLDWKEVFEQLSLVEQTLHRDPGGIYPQMDFATRDHCRRVVEDLSRGSRLEEVQIAEHALVLAREARSDSSTDERSAHVGTFLIGDQRRDLARLIGCREVPSFRARQWVYRHHMAVYFLGLIFFSTASISLVLRLGFSGLGLGIQMIIAALLFIPASQLSLDVLNTLIMRFFPPRTLPKMDFRVSGIPDDCRTLVVVPMMLVDQEMIKSEVEKLEIRYLANKEDNLLFGLYSDFKDADQARCDTDDLLLQTAIQGIIDLNKRYGSERFFLFHRKREWCDSERKFIGWERKRGKLEELNNLIVGTRPRHAARLVYVGDSDRLSDVRFVITLDSDTQLPAGTARRLIETLANPLNQARLDFTGRVRSGYTIIQPRVSPSLPSTIGSPFSRLFSDAVGIDPYTNTVSDAYQDLIGEGSYHGKGIYDVRAFSRILSGRFPESWLLSHDLIEGAHVRVGLASDIELYDEFPQDYRSYVKRQHRWIRGDWQIADWIMPRVPQPGGGRSPNPLSWFDRWKIFDNLRRSLLPAASLALLLAAWLISSRAGWIASAVVVAQLFFHSLLQPFAWATKRRGWKRVALNKMMHDLLRVVVEIALLPYQTWQALDAIAKVWYRRNISHQRLLEWTSAQETHSRSQKEVPMLLLSLGLASAFSALAGGMVAYWQPANLGLAGPWLVLWFLSPVIGWFISRQLPVKRLQSLIPDKDRQFMRSVARRTWRFFSEFVNEDTNWLPPDNYQVSHQNKLALRTSPTNIGLYLVSVLSAQTLGYLTIDGVAKTLVRSLETCRKLERYNGHLLNWYDIQTLAPLKPRYVSTVDSGNLLGSLWTLDQGLQSLQQAPLLDSQAFAGLYDTGSVLQQVAREERFSGMDAHALDVVLYAWESPPDSIADLLPFLRKAGEDVAQFSEKSLVSLRLNENIKYWAEQIERQIEAWVNVADRYLSWIEILAEKTAEEIIELDPEALTAFRQALQRAPSLKDLAAGNIPCIVFLQSIWEKTSVEKRADLDWIKRVRIAFDRSKWLAGEMLASMEQLTGLSGQLSESINMRFLYNKQRRLFSIGFNVTEGRLDRAFYDLLASEARLGSFVAIARGDIPTEHWFAMNRPYAAIGRRRTLLSWTGTMFEYQMPLLFQRSFDKTLLDKATREAVAIQIDYGNKQKVPWGISECAYGDLDLQKTYQYQAFGVPALGLKRGLSDKIVVAPYATLLAATFEPRQAVRNLKRLADLGLLSDYGYYESLDYSRRPGHESMPGVIVRTYMANHQGMSFLALTNFLQDDCLRQYFHTDPRVRTVEPLLYERIPQQPVMHHETTRERVSSVASIGDVAPSVSHFETPHTSTPKTQLLCNGRYSLMVTGAGGGYSHWSDFEITRWRSDTTQDAWGIYCYLHDVDSDQLWCNTYHPTCGEVKQFSANFTLDSAVFRRVDHEIESRTDIIVAPEDDVEIRRMTLINHSNRIRRIELTSYIELSMAPHNADRQHPAFNKLFIQTEALPELGALLAFRRLRGESEPPIYVVHRFTPGLGADESISETMQFETDRRQFIGRGRTLSRPMGALQELSGRRGFVLDPILSLRKSITLSPGQRIQVSLVLGAGPSREQVTDLIHKYGDPHAIDRAMDFAWASAQFELRLLHIQPDEARRFQQLASYLLYPNSRMRSSPQHIADNRKGQAGLWAYSISGDAPIVLIVIGEVGDLGLVRQMLRAHAFWRMHGLEADLVILNDEAGGYAQPLREELKYLLFSQGASAGVDQPRGIYLLNADQLPNEDLTLLRAVAAVVMVAARGALSQQLASAAFEPPVLPESIAKRRDPLDLSAPLPFMELPYFNSLGGATQDGREYAIYLGEDTYTPAPWTNVIANPSFGTIVSESGAGFTWQGNSQRNRLTQWSNDPVMDPPSEAIYLRDEETGIYWTPTASPIRTETAYRARHGAGYTVCEHNSHGIEQELTVFVPMDAQGGEPIKLQKLKLHNDSGRLRRLSLTYYVEWTLGETRETSQMHVVTAWDDEVQAVVARNHYNPDYTDWVAFAAVNAPQASYTADRTTFLGRNRSLTNPAAMERIRLSGRTGAGLDPCAAVQVILILAPGERAEITCMLGQAQSIEKVHALVLAYRDSAQVATTLRHTQEWWDGRLGTIQVHTPELAADILINRWLLYQTLSCRIWGRSGFYQSGGAFGFRDQLQDVMALLYADPKLARRHILLAASRQFKEGDVQHWWHQPGGEGIRSRISDDHLWLPFVVRQYVRITNDVSILHEVVPFLDAPPLIDDQHESFQSPSVSLERATLFEHCQRALAYGQRFGAHGLPLMGSGDWNDGMNLVGAEGKGESVWLAWFMVDVMQGMVEMSRLLGFSELSRSFEEEREDLLTRIEQFAWDGQWYLRATFDDGSLLGSSENTEARIDSLPQSWAWLSGAADRDRSVTALESAWRHLVREDEKLVLLFEPPFDHSEPSPGYIKSYPPGVRENGGQYTHSAIWMAMAMARSGDGSRAAKILRMLNPIERTRNSAEVWRYGIEPYVMAADVYRLQGRIGQGGWSWYTGSAAWMYRAWVEEILGLKIRGETMQIAPVIPSWWEGFRMSYRHGEALYEIQVENPEHCERDVAWLELDGRRVQDGVIPLVRNLIKHRILVRMGKANGRQFQT